MFVGRIERGSNGFEINIRRSENKTMKVTIEIENDIKIEITSDNVIHVSCLSQFVLARLMDRETSHNEDSREVKKQ